MLDGKHYSSNTRIVSVIAILDFFLSRYHFETWWARASPDDGCPRVRSQSGSSSVKASDRIFHKVKFVWISFIASGSLSSAISLVRHAQPSEGMASWIIDDPPCFEGSGYAFQKRMSIAHASLGQIDIGYDSIHLV